MTNNLNNLLNDDTLDNSPIESYDEEEYHLYDTREQYPQDSSAMSCFKGILYSQTTDIMLTYINHEDFGYLHTDEVEDDYVPDDLYCPICGNRLNDGKHKLKLDDFNTTEPDGSDILPLFELSDKKGNVINLHYVRCGNCIDDIQNNFIKNGKPLINTNLLKLMRKMGSYLGLEPIKNDIYPLQLTYPTHKFTFMHKKTKKIAIYNVFELGSLIRFIWNTFLDENQITDYTKEDMLSLELFTKDSEISQKFCDYMLKFSEKIYFRKKYYSSELRLKHNILTTCEDLIGKGYVTYKGEKIYVKIPENASYELALKTVMLSIPLIHKAYDEKKELEKNMPNELKNIKPSEVDKNIAKNNKNGKINELSMESVQNNKNNTYHLQIPPEIEERVKMQENKNNSNIPEGMKNREPIIDKIKETKNEQKEIVEIKSVDEQKVDNVDNQQEDKQQLYSNEIESKEQTTDENRKVFSLEELSKEYDETIANTKNEEKVVENEQKEPKNSENNDIYELTEEEKIYEEERKERMRAVIWKHWTELDDQEFLDRYYLPKKSKIELLRKFNTEENRARYTPEEIVDLALDWYIREKKKRLREEYAANPEKDKQEWEISKQHRARMGLKDDSNNPKVADIKARYNNGQTYKDYNATENHKAEHTDDSKKVEERIERDAERRARGIKPKLLFNNKDEYNEDPFDDNSSLLEEFQKSPFYKVINLMSNLEEHTTDGKLLDFEKTSYIPTIDYASGVRVMFIDLSDMNLRPGNINASDVSDKVRFYYEKYKDIYQLVFVYDTEARAKPEQVARALVKLINYFTFPKKKMLEISRQFVLTYCKDKKEIEAFERMHSVLPDGIGKPKTDSLGIVIMVDPQKIKSNTFKKAEIADSIRNEYYSTTNFSNLNKYKTIMVLAIRYIEHCIDIPNPEPGMPSMYYKYRITQYTEEKHVMVDDGLACCVAALIREHYNKGRGDIPYKICFEFDRTLIISPTLRKKVTALGDPNCPIVMADETANMTYRNTKECYKIFDNSLFIPANETEKKFFNRIDPRFMLTNEITFRKYFGNRIPPNVDVSTDEQKIKFLERMGFQLYYEPSTPVFDIKPEVLIELENHPITNNIIPISINDLRESNAFTSLDLQTKLEYQAALLENNGQIDNMNEPGFNDLSVWSNMLSNMIHYFNNTNKV